MTEHASLLIQAAEAVRRARDAETSLEVGLARAAENTDSAARDLECVADLFAQEAKRVRELQPDHGAVGAA